RRLTPNTGRPLSTFDQFPLRSNGSVDRATLAYIPARSRYRAPVYASGEAVPSPGRRIPLGRRPKSGEFFRGYLMRVVSVASQRASTGLRGDQLKSSRAAGRPPARSIRRSRRSPTVDVGPDAPDRHGTIGRGATIADPHVPPQPRRGTGSASDPGRGCG